MARVLDLPVEALLMPSTGSLSAEVEAAELAILVQQERYADAIDSGRALLKRVLTLADRAEINFQIGVAYFRSIQPADALTFMAEASEAARELLDEHLLISCLNITAQARFILDDPEAVALQEEALRRCDLLKPLPGRLRARILNHLGFMYIQQQRTEKAAETLEEAIRCAGPVQELRLVASAYHNLVGVYDRMGNTSKAVEYARKAEALYELHRDRKVLLWLHSDIAKVLMDAGRLEAAKDHIDHALEFGRDIPAQEIRGRAEVLVILSEWHWIQRDAEAARLSLDEAKAVTDASGELGPQGRIHWLLGRIAVHEKDEAGLVREFGLAIDIFDKLNQQSDLVECHRELGDALADLGRIEEAGRHWRQALSLKDGTPVPAAARLTRAN
jgi:tetratricopeptide (TPR) repeat protein